MTHTEQARATLRRIRLRRIRVAALLVVMAAILAAIGHESLAPSSSTTGSPTLARPELHAARGKADRPPLARREQPGALGEADGAVPGGTTVFDDEVPGVANLDAALRRALRRAAADAAGAGVHFVVDSGWRSAAYQQQLFRQAVLKYGSEREAARWVATPGTSAHVSGDAVDIGPVGATTWLAEHGAEYGLCRVYGNEPWHYELRPEAVAHGCPPMYADPTQDPRMQQ